MLEDDKSIRRVQEAYILNYSFTTRIYSKARENLVSHLIHPFSCRKQLFKYSDLTDLQWRQKLQKLAKQSIPYPCH